MFARRVSFGKAQLDLCIVKYIFRHAGSIVNRYIDGMLSHRFDRRRKCRRCNLGTHCPKCRDPGRRTPHLDSRSFPRPGPGNRNNDRTRRFSACSCNNTKRYAVR